VASSKALDLLNWAMLAVLYRHTAAAINMATFLDVFVDCCLFACCPGGRWGNTEQLVAEWRRPVASGVALDMLHRAMRFVLHRRTAIPSKWPMSEEHFDTIVILVINNNRSQRPCYGVN
jgi:hypothetical protein